MVWFQEATIGLLCTKGGSYCIFSAPLLIFSARFQSLVSLAIFKLLEIIKIASFYHYWDKWTDCVRAKSL